jgi:hypothetical protein
MQFMVNPVQSNKPKRTASLQFFTKYKLILMVVLIVLLSSLLIMAAFLLKKQFVGQKIIALVSQTTAVISGKVDLNGAVEPDSTISIGFRPTKTENFQIKVQDLAGQDGVSWFWNQAESGKNYDVQAYLILNGEVVAKSEILTLTAPAIDEILVINAKPKMPT